MLGLAIGQNKSLIHKIIKKSIKFILAGLYPAFITFCGCYAIINLVQKIDMR